MKQLNIMRLPPGLTSAVLIAVLLCLQLTLVTALKPTAPIVASPNTEASPSNFIFHFELATQLETTSYLMVTLPVFPSIITPFSCILLGSPSSTTATCHNLNTASGTNPNPLTINTTSVSGINPNIDSTLTIVVNFPSALATGTTHSLQIILSDNLPSVGALSKSFEIYHISGTGIMIEENWNMGQLFLELTNNNLMNLVSINAQNANLPGTTTPTVESLLVDITIGVACPTPLSVLLFTISNTFQFTVSSQVTTSATSGSPPQVLSSTVISPNVIKAVFNEQFTVGRAFRVSISNIQNPMEIAAGGVSVYSLPDNSISPLEVSQNSIPYQTVSYTPTVTIFTAEGVSPSAPMEYYLNTEQYITVTVLLPRNLDTNFILQVNSDVLQIQEGTVFARTDTINSDQLQYSLTNSNTVQVSGWSTIPAGSLITITMRVWCGNSPIFNVYVSIDTLAHITAGNPIIYGTSSATVSVTPQTFVSGLTGNAGETDTLTLMQGATSSISFSVTPLFQTFTGSFLSLYTSKDLVAAGSFNTATSCLVNSVAKPCTITTSATHTVITIASNSSYNLFPQSVTTAIQINDLTFNYASSHSMHIYHFYFQLTVSLATLANAEKFLIAPMVVQQRDQLTNFVNYFSNNIYNTGSNFLNVFRLVSSDMTQWQNIIQANQKRIITVFAYQGWTNLFTTLTPYQTYPCASNIAVTCTFLRGSNSLNLTTTNPLNWDRVNIVLPGTQSSSKFSIILPTQFTSLSAALFEIMVGIVDTNNGAITYLQAQPMPTSGQPTYLLPTNIAVYDKPKQAAMQLNIAGLAGSYDSNISFTVDPSASFSGTTYSTCLIVISSWNFFDSLTALAATSIASVDPVFANVEQTPLSLLISTGSYLTYIPFKTAGAFTADFNIIFDSIKLPYNLDLPYYSVSLIDETGALDGYNQFINQNQNIFYTGTLRNLSMTCNDNSLGVTNTFCTVQLTPFQEIEVAAKIVITLTGMFVSTDLCQMTQTANTSAAVTISSCSSNTNLNVLTITLGNSNRLTALTDYQLIINGISIDANTISHYATVQVMDSTGSYSIEEKYVILTTSVSQDFPIFITQANFAYNNPVVYSSLFLNFTLPRTLNADESFAIVMSTDFTNLNSVPSKMRIRLMMADGVTEIPTNWILKSLNLLIVFEGLQSTLTAATYSIEMYGITTPSAVSQDMVGIIYRRNFDNTFTKNNIASSTATFPSLISQINSLITLQTYFNTEGLEQEMLFTVINQFEAVTEDTVWVLNFPRYYSEQIWNEDYLIYCMINSTPLQCKRSMYTPFQIELSQSPLAIEVGATYTISVFGIPCPRASYLNGNTLFVTENIFFGMASSSNATAYVDYSQLFVSNTIIDPQTQAGYGHITLTGATSSNMEVYQTAFFTITLTCSVAISTNQWLVLTFPPEFDNFNNIPVIVQTQYNGGVTFEVSASSPVVNQRVSVQLTSISIPMNTQFQIMITSLQTPKTPATIDMNEMIVMVTAADRLSTTATTIQSRNQLPTLTFTPNSLHLVVNNYNPIMLTAGTYSDPITVRPSDNSTFQTNMEISFTATQLTFSSNPTEINLGNSEATFIIGASQNLIPTTYTFNLIKRETSINVLYSTLSEYAVSVTSTPIVITFPASITVPRGGCSMPALVQLTNPPKSEVQITLQWDTVNITASEFWLHQEMSYETMEFSLTNVERWITFCSNSTIATNSFPVTAQLGGDNSASYSLSTATTTITISDLPALNVAPTFALNVANTQKTYANFEIVTNVPGFFFYHLQLSPMPSPYTLSQIKSFVKSNSMTIASNNDYKTTQIYNSDRDTRVGYMSATIAGSNYLIVESLLPQREYVLCGYFENQFTTATAASCVTFTMQTWGTTQKAHITYNSAILANQLNNLLCFFVKASNSEINQVIDLEGNSCSLNTSPANYYYSYNGNSTSKGTETIIYHMASKNLTSDASISAFAALFDSGGLTTASTTTASTEFSVDFLTSSALLGTFNPISAVQTASGFTPTVSLNIDPYVYSSRTVTVSSITASLPSSLYLILVSYKNITTNQISKKTNITIKPVVYPSNEQIASCRDGSDQPPVQCHRIVMLSGSSYSVTFSNIVDDAVYAMHYVVANEYPERPVFHGSVQTQYIYTNYESALRLMLGGLCLLMLMMTLA